MQISFVTFAPWMQERLFHTFKEAAGYAPLVLEGKMAGTIFLLGQPVKNGTLKKRIPPDYKILPVKENTSARTLNDDWPYLYVQPNVVDWPYLLVLSEIVLISIYASRKFLFARNDPSSWQMFFLGAAFMLLELQAISFLSLLYGSTWVTSALVINGILIMILCANTVVERFFTQIQAKQVLFYLFLFAAILASYFLPVQALLAAAKVNQIAIYGFVSLLTLLPMGIASIIFATSLQTAPNISKALAFNLFGAVIGGLLEYLSNYYGIKSLSLLAIVLYALSALCCFGFKKTNNSA